LLPISAQRHLTSGLVSTRSLPYRQRSLPSPADDARGVVTEARSKVARLQDGGFKHRRRGSQGVRASGPYLTVHPLYGPLAEVPLGCEHVVLVTNTLPPEGSAAHLWMPSSSLDLRLLPRPASGEASVWRDGVCEPHASIPALCERTNNSRLSWKQRL
jgi:hypothetical protein